MAKFLNNIQINAELPVSGKVWRCIDTEGSGKWGNIDYTVVAKTASYNITTGDWGTIFTNEGATSGIRFNLPAADKSLQYTFICQSSGAGRTIQVQVAAGDTIRIGNGITSATGYVQSSNVGETLVLGAMNSSDWVSMFVDGFPTIV